VIVSAVTRPRLAAKARLRFDRKAMRYMLLYPERGLVLNPTAAEIVRLCTGDNTVGDIVERLAAQYPDQAREALEQEVLAFLRVMAGRGLVQEAS
jgi:coenzyme PQQ biosynthesis protein PqqD